jgi:hypothetical protein
MTIGWLVSFGGVLLLGAIGFVIGWVLTSKARPDESAHSTEHQELVDALDRAHGAVRQADAEIAALRGRIAS